jgi:hypothetical protein
MFFEVIDWSENPGKPSFGAMTVGQWWHSARMHSATRRYGNLRSAEMPIVWNATILTGANMIPYDRATGAVSPTAGVSL